MSEKVNEKNCTNAIDRYYTTSGRIREAIKTLRTNIQFSGIEKPLKSIVITSTFPNEGKTTTSIYLAVSMSDTGKKVLIIDCDLRRPMIGKYLDIKKKKGFVDYIAGTEKFEDLICETKCKNLYFLNSGTKIANTVEILGSERFIEMIKDLKEKFDVIIMDTPPLGSFIEAAVISSVADGTLLMMEFGRVEARVAKSILSQLQKANANLIGVAITNVNAISESQYGYYYNYYSYYNNYSKVKKKRKKPQASGKRNFAKEKFADLNLYYKRAKDKFSRKIIDKDK